MPQYLRVRRRRHASTATMLKMEGLMDGRKRNRDAVAEMATLTDASGEAPNSPSRKRVKRSAVWRHVENFPDAPADAQFIDAVLEEEEEERDERSSRPQPQFLSNKKRRIGSTSLKLIDTTRSSFVQFSREKQQPQHENPRYPVLNPLDRMVDDSLQQAVTGDKPVREHWEWCRTDSVFLGNRNRYVSWVNPETGSTILHCCALWNDVDTASEVLMWASSHKCLEPLTQALDRQEATAYQTAKLCGHDGVCQVIASFGGDDDFVYDVYCLEEGPSDDTIDHHQPPGDPSHGDFSSSSLNGQVKVCILQGGVGYWDDKGELVLEMPDTGFKSIEDEEDNGDDEDSNCEGWEGNDYPDEDDDFFPLGYDPADLEYNTMMYDDESMYSH